jgi:hypothetical protein
MKDEKRSERYLRRLLVAALYSRSGEMSPRKYSRLLELIGSVVVSVPADYTRYL